MKTKIKFSAEHLQIDLSWFSDRIGQFDNYLIYLSTVLISYLQLLPLIITISRLLYWLHHWYIQIESTGLCYLVTATVEIRASL